MQPDALMDTLQLQLTCSQMSSGRCS